MSEYIDRTAALAAIRNLYPGAPWLKRNLKWWSQKNKAYIECERAVQSLTAADVAPVKHGHWVSFAEFEQCSVCKATHLKTLPTYYGKVTWVKSRYCPACGAKMDGDESDGHD